MWLLIVSFHSRALIDLYKNEMTQFRRQLCPFYLRRCCFSTWKLSNTNKRHVVRATFIEDRSKFFIFGNRVKMYESKNLSFAYRCLTRLQQIKDIKQIHKNVFIKNWVRRFMQNWVPFVLFLLYLAIRLCSRCVSICT